jgi:hypothetical protein
MPEVVEEGHQLQLLIFVVSNASWRDNTIVPKLSLRDLIYGM